MNQLMAIEQNAEELKKQLGGRIFAFPVNEQDPFSKYAVTMYTEEKWITYPNSLDISEAAAGINLLLETLEKEGHDADYGRNVRFVSYQAQVDAPNVTMRRLKKEVRTGLAKDIDFIPKENGAEGYHISARGLIKFSYYSMIDDKLPKAIQFMDSYYNLLATRKYGKTAAAIKQEIRRMNKNEATKWIEQTYARYITDDMEVMDLMNGLNNA
jgi:hypothetical protein